MSDDDFLKLQEIEEEIARECKAHVKAVEAWRSLILWISSFKNGIEPGRGDANHYLSPQQSAEFAFSFDSEANPDVFILLAQNKLYESLCDIGIKCAIIEDDGIVIFVNNLDANGYFISGFSFKIQCSLALSGRLRNIKKHCKFFQLAQIESKYNAETNKTNWHVSDVFPKSYKLVANPLEAKQVITP